MTLIEIKNMLSSTGLPIAYYQYPVGQAPQLPYLVYYYPQSVNFGADNKVYQKANQLNIELYSKQKSFELEERIENVLDEFEIFYNKIESYIESEEMYEVLYESEVIINGE